MKKNPQLTSMEFGYIGLLTDWILGNCTDVNGTPEGQTQGQIFDDAGYNVFVHKPLSDDYCKVGGDSRAQ